MKDIFIVLGNQLFDPLYLKNYKFCKIFMAEDLGLCTYEKHHKLKILHFLSSMRSYNDLLKSKGFETDYYDCKNNFSDKYEDKLRKSIKESKPKRVFSFEVEDKPFEKKLNKIVKEIGLERVIVTSPMFLNSRDDFKKYLENKKKPLMANYYKMSRIKFDLLVKDEKPVGGKWSFDKDNRKKLPQTVKLPKRLVAFETKHTKVLKKFINTTFENHPGNTENFWLPTTHKESTEWLDNFLIEKLNLFGDYEDAVSQRDNILFHSALSPLINSGLITPEKIVDRLKKLKTKVNLNSLEGYIRQVIGWREFMRGIYQNYSTEMEKGNFFKHKRKFKKEWYSGETGIPPLDHSIKNALKYGWTHHIERLMVLSSLMNLCEIEPKQVYKWFMEMFIDSSEWVMTPNVYGMGLFSDGGIFATKPYICGSSYYLKMMDFKKGEWCETVDGLYWRFINKNRKFFSSNPRLNMMVSVYDKMKNERKKKILSKAEAFITQFTT
ncbi:cryptochrome/photolyase family protein [Pelagibacterales bacterium SAG-MED32]|nr:cryptochrome/photolyase family protein [Pelagibacterales bacterium SAG-MED32]